MPQSETLFLDRRPIRNTILEVSTICLGTMTFGTPVGETDAIKLVRWAVDQGINFIDTADVYEGYNRYPGSAGGVAEEILGKALHGRREKVIVTTKVGNPTGPASKGLARTYILKQVEASLRRLQTNYVDLYELHRPDPDTPLSESIKVMADLIATGKARYWGISNYNANEIQEIISLCNVNNWPKPVACQSPYSWLQRDIEAEILPMCLKHQIALTPYQPLQGGLLSGKYKRGQPLPPDSRASESKWLAAPDEAMYDRLEMFEQEAGAAGLTPAQHAIRWLLGQPGVASVVVGSKSIEQLAELIRG